METIDNAELENVTGAAGLLGQLGQTFLGTLGNSLGSSLGGSIGGIFQNLIGGLLGGGGQQQQQQQGGNPAAMQPSSGGDTGAPSMCQCGGQGGSRAQVQVQTQA